MDKSSYKYETQQAYKERVEQLLTALPEFCKQYLYAKETNLSELTIASYAYNLRVFFVYLATHNPYFEKKAHLTKDYDDKLTLNHPDITIDDISELQTSDIEEFKHDMLMAGNSKDTLSHYISALNGLWKYLVKNKYLKYNPVEGVERLKPKQKKIVVLENEEDERFLNCVMFGTGLTAKQLQYHNRDKERDIAIYFLFLDTGIRISELVGLNLRDFDFESHCFGVIRKGGNYQKIYMSDQCEEYIKEYIDIRESRYKPDHEENALFIGVNGKRLTVRAIQKQTQKYVAASLPRKPDKVTPHKFRSTYATSLLEQTGDIKLVSELLGHANVTTTEKYAKYNNEKLKSVRNLR